MLKGELRRQAILDTAEELFFEKGYVGTTIQDFLDRLDCSKGSFYHHFESKPQVLSELCRQKAVQSFGLYQGRKYEDALSQLNALVYYAMPFRDGEDIYRKTLDPDGLVVMGNEASGIRPAVAAEVGAHLLIPSFGRSGAESLNVAAATAVTLSEFRRR